MSQLPLPEWAPHQAVWIGFPSAADLWEDDLASAQVEVAAFAAAVHADGAGEEVWLVAADEAAANEARRLAPFAKVIVEPFGDIWLRDTGAIVTGSGPERSAQGFGFNGWGGKYDLPGDDSIGERLAIRAQLPYSKADWILEGGAIDGDGSGTFITTEQCLLNPNRNPGFDKDEVEDPNAQAYADAAEALLDADLDVVAIPSPGAVERDGEIIPASYMNFYVGNAAVVVPLYGAPNDGAAVEAIQELFPDRRVVGLRADHILTGGGSFHCISQQVPS